MELWLESIRVGARIHFQIKAAQRNQQDGCIATPEGFHSSTAQRVLVHVGRGWHSSPATGHRPRAPPTHGLRALLTVFFGCCPALRYFVGPSSSLLPLQPSLPELGPLLRWSLGLFVSTGPRLRCFSNSPPPHLAPTPFVSQAWAGAKNKAALRIPASAPPPTFLKAQAPLPPPPPHQRRGHPLHDLHQPEPRLLHLPGLPGPPLRPTGRARCRLLAHDAQQSRGGALSLVRCSQNW